MSTQSLQSLEEARQREMLAKARAGWEPPLPLMPELPPAENFPITAAGGNLEAAIGAIHEKTQAPLAVCAQSAFAATTLAVQGLRNVRLPTGQHRPLSNYFVTIAATGERKTSSDEDALRGVRRHEQKLRDEYESEYSAKKNKVDAYEKQRQAILANNKQFPTWQEKCAALDALGTAPKLPLSPVLTGAKPTTQGIERLMMIGQPSLGIFSSEGGEFIGGYAMTRENKLGTIAWLSSAWDGTNITRITAADGAAIIAGRRICMHLMGQPRVVDQFLADDMVIEQGLLSRTLVTMPNSSVGNRFWKEPSASALDASDAFAQQIYDLLQLPLPLAEGKQNELAPPSLELAPSTARKWILFHDIVEAQVGPGRVLDPVRGLALKAPEIAARLAGTLALYEDPTCGLITPAQLQAAIDIIEYYLLEAHRLFGRAPDKPSVRRALKLWNFLHAKRYALVSLAEICQFGPNELRDREVALAALSLLEKHNYVRRLSGGADINGFHRRQVWLVWEPANGEVSAISGM